MTGSAMRPSDTSAVVGCISASRSVAANSRETASRTRGRPFLPGQSGNPSGRPRRDLDLAALARTHTLEALETLVAVMQDAKSPAAARVSAATALLDRGWGRPRQALDVHDQLDLAGEFERFVRGMHMDATGTQSLAGLAV